MNNKTLYDNIVYDESYNGVNVIHQRMYGKGNKLKETDLELEKQLLSFIVEKAYVSGWYDVPDYPYKMMFNISFLFENASLSVKKDKKFMLSVIKQHMYLLEYADESLKNDDFFALECIRYTIYNMLCDDADNFFYNFNISKELQTIIHEEQKIYKTCSKCEILQMLIKEEEINPIYKMKCYDCFMTFV
jgi:hypothetical protein